MFSSKKSLATILAGFTKTITELESLQVQNDADIKSKSDTVSQLNAEIEAHVTEKAAADSVLKNIKALLNQ